MASSEPGQKLLEVLSGYFSAPIAQLFLTNTLGFKALEPGVLSPDTVGSAVDAIAAALPAYLADATRRQECITRLREVVPRDVPQTRTMPSIAPGSGRSKRPPEKTRHESLRPAPMSLPVQSAEDVVRVCDATRDFAGRVGFPQVLQTKIATAVAELARNLQLYARGGEVHIATFGEPARGVEIVTTDQGPGITNLDAVLSGKYRSRTGMGMGLRGARRLMDTFEIASSASGTKVVVRKFLA